jgi:hypothetical protein
LLLGSVPVRTSGTDTPLRLLPSRPPYCFIGTGCCACPGFVSLVGRVRFLLAVTGSVAISSSTNLFISGTFLRWFSIQMLVFEIVRLAWFDFLIWVMHCATCYNLVYYGALVHLYHSVSVKRGLCPKLLLSLSWVFYSWPCLWVWLVPTLPLLLPCWACGFVNLDRALLYGLLVLASNSNYRQSLLSTSAFCCELLW